MPNLCETRLEKSRVKLESPLRLKKSSQLSSASLPGILAISLSKKLHPIISLAELKVVNDSPVVFRTDWVAM
jgi:hypothetical protein